MQSQSSPDVVSPDTASPDAVSIAAPLTSLQARQVQHMAANVLVEAYASGTFPAMNDVLLRRRVEYYLELVPNRLETQQGRMLVSQIRWLVVFHAALESVTIRYAILGLALEHVRRYLQS
ncbi:hypothetical protein CCMSSC00406_0007164 [Pleurotus cornucopiae]|uniref:Uncharacterized protein n=1 Tax=Pleurotus cornucopiae TaxID=5321 RepID=A0ACB7IR81_PLECO|nr:hypothetical protein CCMSSC00406_0007164 [Pleurotus cornucopiae]